MTRVRYNNGRGEWVSEYDDIEDALIDILMMCRSYTPLYITIDKE